MSVGGAEVNKAQLIDALTERLGDKKIATAAVAGLIDVVIRVVAGGDRVTITGFGVFDKRARAARIARNPRTGEAVTVEQTDVPAFRPGTLFREVVSGTRTLPEMDASINIVAALPDATAASQPAMTSVPTGSSAARATSRPATRVTAGGRRTTVNVAATSAVKAPKAAKPAAEEAKVAKKKSKTATKAPEKAPPKITAKKAVVKKSGTKKSGTKK